MRFYGCICHDMMNPEPIEYTLRSYPRFRRNWYYPKFRLATWHPVGVLTDAVADQIIEFVEMQEHDQDELFDRYTDFSGLTKIQLKLSTCSTSPAGVGAPGSQ